MSGGLFNRNQRPWRRNNLVARLTGGIGDDDGAPEPQVQPAEQESPSERRTSQSSRRQDDISTLSDDSTRKCWICYATDAEDEPSMEWISPCRCRGSMKWVHDKCLQMYIDSRIGTDTARTVLCPQCKTPYVLVFPKMSRTLYVMDTCDRAITRTCPYLAAGMLVGSVYWAAVTYGAVTVMQVAGHEEGLELLERADPMFLLVGLPTIPVFLIMGKMIRWEEKVLIGLRAVTERLPVLGYLLPGFRPVRARRANRRPSVIDTPPQQGAGGPLPAPGENANEPNAGNNNNGDEQLIRTAFMATRVFCSALLFPAVASVAGKVCFPKTATNWRRSLYGGLAFVAVKGVIKIYYMQNLYNIRLDRRVKNFADEDVSVVRVEAPSALAMGASSPSVDSRSVRHRRPTPAAPNRSAASRNNRNDAGGNARAEEAADWITTDEDGELDEDETDDTFDDEGDEPFDDEEIPTEGQYNL